MKFKICPFLLFLVLMFSSCNRGLNKELKLFDTLQLEKTLSKFNSNQPEPHHGKLFDGMLKIKHSEESVDILIYSETNEFPSTLYKVYYAEELGKTLIPTESPIKGQILHVGSNLILNAPVSEKPVLVNNFHEYLDFEITEVTLEDNIIGFAKYDLDSHVSTFEEGDGCSCRCNANGDGKSNFCTSGGEGSSSCSLSGECSVTCNSGYYACCSC